MDYHKFDNVFAKIGGINALHEIVDRFYDKVMADNTVNNFFKDANMDIQRGKMKAFLMMALGGPAKFTGKDMRQAHARLVTNGLADIHFDTIILHLDNALNEFGVVESTRNDVRGVIESVRADVLNK
ncbi:MAG: group 1 truncated hemoglobin [Cyclobacteriaceae bacterium]|nr:group 1 truncated hemoglobin [Cyclobacteriaceae bacterium]